MGFAPRLHLTFATEDPGLDDAYHRVAREQPGRIVAALPEGTALALHGRQVHALGEGRVGIAVYRDRQTLVSEAVISGRSSADAGEARDNVADWLMWVRLARAAVEPVHPPADPVEPILARGALIVHGGGRVGEETWRAFIDLAGGVDAKFVCIPSAGEIRDGLAPSSYSARELTERGCTNVRIVHVSERERADRDRDLIAAIDACSGVWIDGGRTYLFADRIGETEVARAIARALERGGVVGGSSAGCQVIGDFLVRGNPQSNDAMVYPGYTRGLQLIRGVIFDAHFRERSRHNQLGELTAQYPQMLGIGVDAKTALLIRGRTATVLGETGVDVFDRRHGRTSPERGVAVEAGGSFDLVDGPPQTK